MWKEIDNKLYQKFSFKDFVEAFAFMTKVAIISEKMNHHATITNTYNTVELWLSTHDAGNKVTEKDQQLSQKINAILGK
jgi:4a-hydroxytetrahydrobiopterin dehydratase